MLRLLRVPLLLLVAGTLTDTSRAQSAPAAATHPDAIKSADAANTTSARPKRERTGVAAALAASLPKYNPPPKPNPEDEDVDLRDVDKPRNGIIRLPKYTVQEKKPPVFRERDLFNRAGFADLAKRRYLTGAYRALNSFYIPLFSTSPEEHALAMYEEDERLKNMADLKDNARTVSRSDRADAAAVQDLADDAYMRRSQFGFQPSDLRRE